MKTVRLEFEIDEKCLVGIPPDEIESRLCAVAVQAVHSTYGGHDGFLKSYVAFRRVRASAPFRLLKVGQLSGRRNTIPEKETPATIKPARRLSAVA